MSTNPPSRCRVELDLDALRTNLDRVRARLGPHAPLIAMVKADAYGLGAEHVVPTLRDAGVECFGVAGAGEARALRDLGVDERIVVFGPFAPGMEHAVVAAGAEATVSDISTVERFAAAARDQPVPIHLEVDTGMGRAGLRTEVIETRAADVVASLSMSGVRWAGVFTHLHSADEPGRPGVAKQIDAFQRLVGRLSPPEDVELHVANSAAAFWDGLPPSMGARPGIYLYGGVVPGAPTPAVVAAVRATIVRVVDVPTGATVGYGGTYAAAGPERWATAAIGYGDGLPRSLSNRGRALVHGRPAPIVGRVSMDLTVLNVTGRDDVHPGDDATFLGVDGPDAIALEEIAGHADTISYEVLTGLATRMPRLVSRPQLPSTHP
jgi:alanine racemase